MLVSLLRKSQLITPRDPANGDDAAASAFHDGHGPYQTKCQQYCSNCTLSNQ